MSHEFFKLHNIFSIRYLQLNFTNYTYNNDQFDESWINMIYIDLNYIAIPFA